MVDEVGVPGSGHGAGMTEQASNLRQGQASLCDCDRSPVVSQIVNFQILDPRFLFQLIPELRIPNQRSIAFPCDNPI